MRLRDGGWLFRDDTDFSANGQGRKRVCPDRGEFFMG